MSERCPSCGDLWLNDPARPGWHSCTAGAREPELLAAGRHLDADALPDDLAALRGRYFLSSDRAADAFDAALAEVVRLRAALAQAECERDIYKAALDEVHDYARTSYAEGAMRGERHDGFRDFQHIVNVARRAFRAAVAPPPEEEASRE